MHLTQHSKTIHEANNTLTTLRNNPSIPSKRQLPEIPLSPQLCGETPAEEEGSWGCLSRYFCFLYQ